MAKLQPTRLLRQEATLLTDFPWDLREWACPPMHSTNLAHKTMT